MARPATVTASAGWSTVAIPRHPAVAWAATRSRSPRGSVIGKPTKGYSLAIFGDSYGIFHDGAATPDIAASIAGLLCTIGSKRGADDEECRIVSVDGEWVDYFVAQPLPERTGAIEDLLQLSARKEIERYNEETTQRCLCKAPWATGAGVHEEAVRWTLTSSHSSLSRTARMVGDTGNLVLPVSL